MRGTHGVAARKYLVALRKTAFLSGLCVRHLAPNFVANA
jgi:hypothetical protein